MVWIENIDLNMHVVIEKMAAFGRNIWCCIISVYILGHGFVVGHVDEI